MIDSTKAAATTKTTAKPTAETNAKAATNETSAKATSNETSAKAATTEAREGTNTAASVQERQGQFDPGYEHSGRVRRSGRPGAVHHQLDLVPEGASRQWQLQRILHPPSGPIIHDVINKYTLPTMLVQCYLQASYIALA